MVTKEPPPQEPLPDSDKLDQSPPSKPGSERYAFRRRFRSDDPQAAEPSMPVDSVEERLGVPPDKGSQTRSHKEHTSDS